MGPFLSNVHLGGSDLRGLNLQGVDLSGTDLSGCNLYEIPEEVYEMDWIEVLDLSPDYYFEKKLVRLCFLNFDIVVALLTFRHYSSS